MQKILIPAKVTNYFNQAFIMSTITTMYNNNNSRYVTIILCSIIAASTIMI